MNLKIIILKDKSGNLTISFFYTPQFVQKIKTIKGYKWHLGGKYWFFLNTDGILKRILKIFEGEKIYIDPAPQSLYSSHCEAMPKQSQVKKCHSKFSDIALQILREYWRKIGHRNGYSRVKSIYQERYNSA